MQILAWFIGVVALGINAHAVVALVLGLRSRDAGTMARYAGRCAWSVAGVALLACGSFAASFLMGGVSGPTVDPIQKATILATGISELMNCAAFTVLAGLLPSIAAGVLTLRRR